MKALKLMSAATLFFFVLAASTGCNNTDQNHQVNSTTENPDSSRTTQTTVPAQNVNDSTATNNMH